MNSLMIGVLILAAICVINGYRKGFVRIVFSLVATVVTIVIVGNIAPTVADILVRYTPMEEMIAENFSEIIIDETAQALVDTVEDGEEIPLKYQIEIIQDADIPEYLQELLLDNNNSAIYEKLGVDSFVDYISYYLASWVIKVVAFVLAFLFAIILVRVFVFSLDVVAALPVFNGLNRIAGAITGLGFAVIIVWVGFVIVMLMYSSEFGQVCYEMIDDSALLTMLYEKNMIMDMLIK